MDEINKKHKGKYFMKILIIILIMLPTIILNSCTSAKRSSDVQVARVSSAPYLKMTCAELGTERRIVLERLDAARSKVDSEYDSEKATELVTWLLFAPAAFFLQGNAQEQAEFSQARGTYDAIEEARKVARKLKIKSYNEYISYGKNGKLPETIPNRPEGKYKNKGWISYKDFLGY